jgi:hypothetical protein
MKKFFLILIASMLVAGFTSVSFASLKSGHAGTSACKIVSSKIVENIIRMLNHDKEDTIFELNADQFASNDTVIRKKSARATRISKCNKSKTFVLDKKSILKTTHFKSDIELRNARLKYGALNLIAVNDLTNISTAAIESIQETSLTTLQSFLL